MKKKNNIAILSELSYLFTVFAYLLYLKITLSFSLTLDNFAFYAISVAIIGLLILIGHRFNRYVAFILLAIVWLYLAAQNIYYRAFTDYFRINAGLGLMSELSDFKGSANDFISFKDYLPLIILFVITIVAIIAERKLEKGYKVGLIRLVGVALIVLSVVVYYPQEKKTLQGFENRHDDFDVFDTDGFLYEYITSNKTFVSKFGLFTFAIRDSETIFENNKNEEKDIAEVDEYYKANKKDLNTNDFTGILEGKNVLIVQAESLVYASIMEEFMPNTYYYMHNGISFPNFATPLLFGSTSSSEYMANTSLYPESDGLSVCYEYGDNTYPLTLATLFKNYGYSASAIHGNYGLFYNRNVLFPSMGYRYYDSKELGEEGLLEDRYMVDKMSYILASEQPFYGFWITYSMHQEYKYTDVAVSKEDCDFILERYPDLEERYVAFLAKAMDFDRALGHFIDVMDWTGLLDNTVILVYGDHHAKAIDFEKGSTFDKYFGLNVEDHPEVMQTPLFIYGADVPSYVCDSYGTALDIFPTIANLMGFNYDPTLIFGKDLLDNTLDHFCFDAGNDVWNKDFYYSAVNNSYKKRSDNYNQAVAERIVNEYNQQKMISKKLLGSDYYAKD